MRYGIAVLALLAACGSNDAQTGAAAADTATVLPRPDSAPATPAVDTPASGLAEATPAAQGLRGKVVASGTANLSLTTLDAGGGQMTVLRGGLEEELRALAGATVQVDGRVTTENNRRIVDVQTYEVIDINGEKPVVGTLVQSQKLATATDTLDVIGEVKAPPGSKVWITGDRSGKQLRVRSYGVIR